MRSASETCCAAAQMQQSPEPARAPPQRARSKRGAESFAEEDTGTANGRKRSRVRPYII